MFDFDFFFVNEIILFALPHFICSTTFAVALVTGKFTCNNNLPILSEQSDELWF